MPTIIALDVSLSMTRMIPAPPGQNNEELTTYHQFAVRGINQFLTYLSNNSKLEYVCLLVYSTLYEIIIDFTRDYEIIKQSLHNIEHYDKANVENVLQAASSMMVTNWGNQNSCQILVFSDCGIGMNATSVEKAYHNMRALTGTPAAAQHWTSYSNATKISFVCVGDTSDQYFQRSIQLYQDFVELVSPKGCIFVPRLDDGLEVNGDVGKKRKLDHPTESSLNSETFKNMIERMCTVNYGRFEATLKCGDYFKLESPVIVWPAPNPYKHGETTKTIKRKLEICGYLSLNDIGSPMSVSRHLIVPNPTATSKIAAINKTHEKMEDSLRTFYGKTDVSEEEPGAPNADFASESICVLLHGALKVENMAALVLLNDNWYAFIYSYADNKKKSNLMLTILPPGHDVIPWIGDLRNLGVVEASTPPGDVIQFPIKPEKRSYSQNCAVWIKQAGLQSDIQKVLRHAKKLPEKTQHFYRELNRIRRAALSMGFIELLEALANLFRREIHALPSSASADCAIQLNHAAHELLKINNRDLKIVIAPLPNKYNQLV